MSNSITDVKVSISAEKVIRSAEFGIPLLYQPTDQSSEGAVVVDYTECYDLSEVEKAVEPLWELEDADYQCNASNLTSGEDLTVSSVNSEMSTIFRLYGKNSKITIEENEKYYNGVKYEQRIKGIDDTDHYFVINSPNDHRYLKIICIAANSSKETTVYLRSDASSPTSGTIVGKATIGGTDVSEVVFEVEEENYCLYTVGETAMHIYDMQIVEPGRKAVALYEQAKYIFNAENAPEKVAVLCCNIDNLINYENYDWRQLIINCTTGEQIEKAKKAALTVESMDIPKLVYVEYSDGESSSFNITTAEEFAGFTRVVFMHTTGYSDSGRYIAYPNASALVGEISAKAIGSYTYKNIYLPDSVQVYENMKKSQLEALHNAGGMCVVSKAGYNVTSEGKTTGGEYIDIIDAIDWVTTNIEYAIQQALIINDKIAYTDSGIDYLATLVTNVLQKATVNGMINTLDSGIGDYTVDFPGRASTEKEDRQARKYTIGTFEFAVAGAVHTVVVKGTLTY